MALVLCFLGSGGETRGQELIDLQQKFNVAYAKLNEPVTQLDASYAQALQRLFNGETSAGRLDSAIQVKAEIDGFADGADFDRKAFLKRASENQALEDLRQKYLGARRRMLTQSKDARGALMETFIQALKTLELRQTQAQQLELALSTRRVRETLADDLRFQDLGQQKTEGELEPAELEGRIYFVAKGEVELRHNGDKISYRNRAERDDGEGKSYVVGETRPRDFKAGDIVLIRMRSQAVYRTMIMALQSEDGSVVMPFKLNDYRYLGEDVRGTDLDREKLLTIVERPAASAGDPDMVDFWNDTEISKEARSASEWVKIGSGDDWHTYAVLIREDALVSQE